ncbi:MAG: ABC transporter substrate-binding protein [Nitrosomonadales bacterium]|nr:ABC transporter substrate-binding protein [Nitrosomonadales bacterium]
MPERAYQRHAQPSMRHTFRPWQKFLFLASMLFALPSHALDHVTLQLKWTHAFQFAGYYAAKEQGYYREAGLDVSIVEALPGVDPVNNVLEGKAEFGVGTSALLLQRKAGKPVVALAVIFQHSPYVLIARQLGATQTIHDLAGKRVMLEPQADELLAYLKKEGIPLDRITQIEHSYDPQDLVDGKIDAIAGYTTNQPYYFYRARFPYQIYTPRSAGIDFYGDNLFTTEQELKMHPERAQAFRAASLRGWKYATEHSEEMADLILAKYSRRHTRDYFLFEAKQTMALIHPELIEVGYMNASRWRHIADTYADIGMLPRDFSLDGFLYDPDPRHDMAWLYRGLAALLLLSVVTGILVIFRKSEQMNRQLEERVAAAQQALAASFDERRALEISHAAAGERERIYRDLHDDVGAKLLGLAISAQRADLPHAADLARSALQDLRDVVSRSAQPVTPLGDLVADWRAETELRLHHIGIALDWRIPAEDMPMPVSAEAALNLSRILREAVTNVLRHARQADRIAVNATLKQGCLILSIEDNGPGLPPGGARPHRGMTGMRARAAALGADLAWQEVEPNGCRVALKMPLANLLPENAGAATAVDPLSSQLFHSPNSR